RGLVCFACRAMRLANLPAQHGNRLIYFKPPDKNLCALLAGRVNCGSWLTLRASSFYDMACNELPVVDRYAHDAFERPSFFRIAILRNGALSLQLSRAPSGPFPSRHTFAPDQRGCVFGTGQEWLSPQRHLHLPAIL